MLTGYINEFKIHHYEKCGINKVDIDFHSAHFDRYRFTGRESLANEQEDVTVRALRHYGIDDLGFEVFYAFPGQTLQEWSQALDQTLAYEPVHMAVEPLPVPDDSKLARELGNLRKVYGDGAEFHRATGNELEEMRQLADERLKAAGFAEYLPGKYALPGHERRYLQAQAHGCERLALGAGGITHIDGVCSKNVSDIRRYIAANGDIAKLTERAWQC